MTHANRFVYDSARTRVEAELRLEDYFASGEISPAESPLIQTRNHVFADGISRTSYNITLAAD